MLLPPYPNRQDSHKGTLRVEGERTDTLPLNGMYVRSHHREAHDIDGVVAAVLGIQHLPSGEDSGRIMCVGVQN